MIPALLAGGAGLAADVVYVFVIRSQRGVSPRVLFIAGLIGVLSLACAGAVRAGDPRVKIALLTGATSGFLSVGMLALASFGVLLLVAGGLAGWALLRVRTSIPLSTARGLAAAATVTVLAVLYAGMAATSG